MGACLSSAPVQEAPGNRPQKVVEADYLPHGRRISVIGGPAGAKVIPAKDAARRRRLSVVTTPKTDALKTLKDNCNEVEGGSIVKGYGKGYRAQQLPIRWGEYSRPGNDPMKNIKENQDSYVVIDNFGGRADQLFVGVFDGHGPQGTAASSYLTQRLPQSWQDHDMESNFFNAMVEGCKQTNEELIFGECDCYLSGSTACSSFFQNNKLYFANVGDSRAVLARDAGNAYHAIDLTSDHKPDRPDERKRIESSGGRVFEWGVPRVWLKNADMPGLAMSRSFGDQCAQSIGVFAVPELSEVTLSSADKFIIWASDGVWEFLSSQDAVDIVTKHMKDGPQEACNALVKASVERWNEEEDVVDDTTAVIAFLGYTQRIEDLVEDAYGGTESNN